MTALRLLGALLLILSGTGAGLGAARKKRAACERANAFGNLLAYLSKLLACQALPSAVLLERAGRYAGLCVPQCRTLSELPVPACLTRELQTEIRDELTAIEEMPRATACEALERLAALCREQARTMRGQADEANRLLPRLGACAGILAAILLW